MLSCSRCAGKRLRGVYVPQMSAFFNYLKQGFSRARGDRLLDNPDTELHHCQPISYVEALGKQLRIRLFREGELLA